LFDTSGRPFSTTTLLRSGFFWPPETAHPFGPNSCTRSAGQLAARPAAHTTLTSKAFDESIVEQDGFAGAHVAQHVAAQFTHRHDRLGGRRTVVRRRAAPQYGHEHEPPESTLQSDDGCR